MGKNMVLRLHEQGVDLVAWNRSPEPREEVKQAGVEVAETVEELLQILKSEIATPAVRNDNSHRHSEEQSDLPAGRLGVESQGLVIWLMLPAGEIVDQFIDQILPHLSEGDL